VAPPPPSTEPPKVPPVIVFAMPVDGDAEVAADSRFTVQFSKDMEESSFQNRVVLRYAGPAAPGDRPITNMTFTYDAGRRTLVVDPGMVLAPGRTLELLLLPGIVDAEGVALAPRASPAVEGIADVLRYSTGS
jgi:Big-like domain-containing protein